MKQVLLQTLKSSPQTYFTIHSTAGENISTANLSQPSFLACYYRLLLLRQTNKKELVPCMQKIVLIPLSPFPSQLFIIFHFRCICTYPSLAWHVPH